MAATQTARMPASPTTRSTLRAVSQTLDKHALAEQLDDFVKELECRAENVVQLIQRIPSKSFVVKQQLQLRHNYLETALSACKRASEHVRTSAQ